MTARGVTGWVGVVASLGLVQACGATPPPAPSAGSTPPSMASFAAPVAAPPTLEPPATAGSASTAASITPPALPAEPIAREVKQLSFLGGRAAFYPPDRSRDDAPITIYLHGMCASGELECPVFAAAARGGYLVCPDGAGRCDGGGFLWSSGQSSQEARLEAAVSALGALPGASPVASKAMNEAPRTLIGYSLGAPAALLQVVRSPGRYDRLMLVNASTEPTAAQLKKAGIVRIALVAGQRDATAGKLAAAAKRLAAAGLQARFFALEATGHYFDGQSNTRMAVPLAWLQATEPPPSNAEPVP